MNTPASCWRTGHGGHRPTMVCLAHYKNSSLPSHARPLVVCYSKNGEGGTANSDAGDGSAIVRKKGASNYSLKALVLASETKGFTA